MGCGDEWEAMQEALENYGPTSDEYIDALGNYLVCMIPIIKGRQSHGAAWDEKLFQLEEKLRHFWDELFGKLDIPPRPCGRRSLEIRGKIFDNSETAMTFSQSIEQAFEKAGMRLEDDETFACLVCVRKKPTYISEVINSISVSSGKPTHSPVDFIMEPTIMRQVMDAIERDKIKYPVKVKSAKEG